MCSLMKQSRVGCTACELLPTLLTLKYAYERGERGREGERERGEEGGRYKGKERGEAGRVEGKLYTNME